MNAAEVGLALAVLLAPVLLGALAGYFAKPWWWAALAAIGLFLVAAIAPEPEAGESRVAAGDIAFLVVVAAMVAGLVWLGHWLSRRLSRH
jgi:hypothetical protein